jgi:protein-S-isoprenylcysteine O-methyltransferase Ste14
LNRHLRIAVLILALIALSLAGVRLLGNPMPLAFCTPAAGVIAFFHLYTDRIAGSASADTAIARDARLRSAIAGAVVVQYLVLVGIVAYFLSGAEKLPALTETMLTSFTTVTGIVVAFYFGATAYVEAKSVEAKAGPAATASPQP